MRSLGTGTVLDGRFRIEEIIGRGGMGAVYRASDTMTGKAVAIKELLVHIESPGDRDVAFKQFAREAELLVRLSHPGIPEMIGYFQHGDSAYLAMEFVEGVTLESLVCDREELPVEADAISWGLELCEVLAYLHEQTPPIIFRDLKPSNVMVAHDDHIKLIDFGIAKRLDPVFHTASYLRGSGTPGYAPMEQYGKGTTDPRSDLYSLGATLYFLMTGRDPPQSVDIATGVEPLVQPRAYNPQISPAMEGVILRLMGLKQDDRYPSADAAYDALNACRGAPRAATGSLVPSSRHPTDRIVDTRDTMRAGSLTHMSQATDRPRGAPPEEPPSAARPSQVKRWLVPLALLAVSLAAWGYVRLTAGPPPSAPWQVKITTVSNKQAAVVEKEYLAGLEVERWDMVRKTGKEPVNLVILKVQVPRVQAEALRKKLQQRKIDCEISDH